MNSTHLLSGVYILLAITSLVGAFTLNTDLHFGARTFLIPSLLSIYILGTPKKKWNILYIIMILLFGIGGLFYVFVEDYFLYSFGCYFIAHFLFTKTIYDNYLVNKSFFDIFSFSLPFLLPFSIILLLYQNLTIQWKLIFSIYIFLGAINGSVVLINYAKTKNIQNYLFFMGFFILSLVSSLAGVYIFNIRDDLFYLLSLTLDLIAKYMICRGFLLKREDGLIV